MQISIRIGTLQGQQHCSKRSSVQLSAPNGPALFKQHHQLLTNQQLPRKRAVHNQQIHSQAQVLIMFFKFQ